MVNDREIDSLIEKEAEKAYDKASEKFQYPKGVVSEGDYDNYLIFSKQWKEHIQRFFTIKDLKLDLAQSPEKIEQIILPLKLSKTDIDLRTVFIAAPESSEILFKDGKDIPSLLAYLFIAV